MSMWVCFCPPAKITHFPWALAQAPRAKSGPKSSLKPTTPGTSSTSRSTVSSAPLTPTLTSPALRMNAGRDFDTAS